MFIISGTNDKLWNGVELLEYLTTNQNQHIKLRINPEAIDIGALGIYRLLDAFEFQQVDIITENPLETHDRYRIINGWQQNRFLRQIWRVDQTLHSWNQKQVFLGFYHRPTAGRLAISAHLLNHYPDLSKIHFSYGTDLNDLMHFEMDKLLNFGIACMDGVPDLLRRLPIWSRDQPENLAKIENCIMDEIGDVIHQNIYPDVLIDIVVESHVMGKTFFPTEKTVRPIWLKKPFIMFASRDYLDYLHQMGFKTFGEYWSEDYDGYEGKDRFEKICKLIEWLAAQPTNDLLQMYQDMQPILDHNYNLLKTQTYSKKITLIT